MGGLLGGVRGEANLLRGELGVQKGGPRVTRGQERPWCSIRGEWKDEMKKHILSVKEETEKNPKNYLISLTTPYLRYFGEGKSPQPHHLALVVSNQVFSKAVFLLSFTCFGEDNLLLQIIPIEKNVVRPEVYLLKKGK